MATAKSKLPKELAAAFEEDAAFGFEEVTSQDLQIPFVRIAQKLSPQLSKNDPAFISGISVGDIFNTVTKQWWEADEGVVVLPVHFQMKFLEFIPRAQGGGFQGELAADSHEVLSAVFNKETGIELLSNGNELVRTAQHYVKIVHEDGSLENAIVDMKKSQLKKSRQWLTQMTMKKHRGKLMPSFANSYRLKSVEEKNEKGDWGTWSITLEGIVPSVEAYEECKDFYKSVNSGELKAALPPQDVEAITDQSEEVPF